MIKTDGTFGTQEYFKQVPKWENPNVSKIWTLVKDLILPLEQNFALGTRAVKTRFCSILKICLGNVSSGKTTFERNTSSLADSF